MLTNRFGLLFLLATLPALPHGRGLGQEPQPEVLDSRLALTLFAEQPTIATPTGIDVDAAGRVWVLESNTHFPPDSYDRHPTDRLYVMRDTNGDGRADQVRVFADGFTHAMSVAVRPSGRDKFEVFVATRAAILRLFDEDGDGTCDRREPMIRLETEGTYPHNGLAGFAFDGRGNMIFGLGENLGEPYTLIGSDGRSYSGGGEGGNVYRCRPDGSQLEHWATGFWNPHASCIDAFGRLFTVDNDPDSRPPCRLLHVIEGGDYGYRFRNGRKGLHPFTAWDGEVPGTLPMVAGTGEAPSGIVAYESDGLPGDYQGNLLITSWGDHRIDRFELQPRGASFTARSEPIVRGGENFRPVGLAVAPDGSLYFSDWVLRDYKLHGRGRVWRLAAREPRGTEVIDVRSIDGSTGEARCRELLGSRRLAVRRAAARALAATPSGRETLVEVLHAGKPDSPASSKRAQVEALWALFRQNRSPDAPQPPKSAPPSPLPAWHLAALRNAPNEVAAAAQRLVDQDADPRQEFSETTPLAVPPRQVPQLAGPNAGSPVAGDLLMAVVEHLRLADLEAAEPLLAIDDPFLFATAVRRFARDMDQKAAEGPGNPSDLQALAPRVRLGWLLALRSREPRQASFLPRFLQDADADVRRAAVQWAAEEQLTEFRGDVAGVLRSGPVNSELFLATLAALQMLDGVDPRDIDKTPPRETLWQVVRDAERPANLRALALRMLPLDAASVPASPGTSKEPSGAKEPSAAEETNAAGLSVAFLATLLDADSLALRLEAVRTLRQFSSSERDVLLRCLAADARQDDAIRAEAVGGLATAADEQQVGENRSLLLKLIASEGEVLRREALRSLRSEVRNDAALREHMRREAKLADLDEQLMVALGRRPAPKQPENYLAGGDAQAGRRVFFHALGPACFKCHTVAGRGGAVGPDLSVVARTMDRAKLAESLLEPSKEVSPQFTNWLFLTDDGRQYSGMILSEEAGTLRIGTAEGEVRELSTERIEQRRPQRVSVMPAGLPDLMTAREFQDLLAFLETLR